MNKSYAAIATVAAVIVVFLAVLILGVAHEHASDDHDHGHDSETFAQSLGNGHNHAHADGNGEVANSAQEYICPMHPQVRSTDPAERCPICGMELVPVTSSARDEDTAGIEFSGRALALLNLQTEPATRQRGEQSIRLVGQLEFDENALTSISAWTAGRIERLHISYTGAEVSEGEALVEIYSPELLVAQQELIQAYQQTQGNAPGFLRESNQTTLNAARERLRLLGLGTSQLDAIVERGEASDRVTIYAPGAGMVTRRAVRQGDYVERGDTILELADGERMWAVFEVYERDLSAISRGQQVEFQVRHRSGDPLRGEVVSIAPAVDAESRTRQIRVAINNPDASLVAGSFVQAQMQLEQDEQLLVPASAPLITGKRALVYVQESEGYFAAREVELGSRLGAYYAVLSGLEEGELVVSRGAFRIDSELQLRGRPSMMAPEGNGATGHEHHSQGNGHGDDHGDDAHDEHSGHEGHGDAHAHNGHAEQDHTHEHASSRAFATDYDIALQEVFELYENLWYALKEDDLPAWQQAAPAFYDAVSSVDWPQSLAEIETQLSRGAGHAHHVSAIERARDHFYYQSQALIALAQAGYHEGTLYLMFCPMARDDQGAYWLQTDSQLLNPYFGSSMLRCGSVRGELDGDGVSASDAHEYEHDQDAEHHHHDHGGHGL